jgi:hypothetical protein
MGGGTEVSTQDGEHKADWPNGRTAISTQDGKHKADWPNGGTEVSTQDGEYKADWPGRAAIFRWPGSLQLCSPAIAGAILN